METENVIANSKDKLIKKNMDMIVANNVKVAGAGFGTDTNVVTIITGEDNIELPEICRSPAKFPLTVLPRLGMMKLT